MTPEQTADVLNDRIRDLNKLFQDYVFQPADNDVDLGYGRVVNLGDPKDDLDGVNLRTLRKFGGASVTSNTGVPTTLPIQGATPFTVTRETYGFLTLYYNQQDNLRVDALRFLALSVDETDPGFQIVLTMDGTTAKPTVTPIIPGFPFAPATSRLGKVFTEGMYLVANDPKKFIIGGVAVYVYEIVKLSKKLLSGDWVIERTPAGAPTGDAQFGSKMSAHANVVFFPLTLDPRIFPRMNWPDFTEVNPGVALQQREEFAYPNKCVSVVMMQAEGEFGLTPVYTQNLAIVSALTDLIKRPPLPPGLRTLNGNQYDMTVSGILTAGQNADVPIRVAGWEGVRCAIADLLTAGSGEVIVDLCYVTPDLKDIGLVETFDFNAGDLVPGGQAFPGPQGRDIPYHLAGWISTILPAAPVGQQDWPMNLFPRMVIPDPVTGLVNAVPALSKGRPITGYVLDRTHSVVMQEHGRLDLLVRSPGGAVDLIASLRT
jgi:hypothetical protein